MDILAIPIGLIIAAGLVFFIARPLRQARRAAAHDESQLDTLLARRESLYTQLRELDFDHVTGKVTDADYAPLRERLRHEAAGVLRRIDALIAARPASGEDEIEQAVAARRKRDDSAAALEADLEAAITAHRKRTPATAPVEAQLEAEIASRRKTLTCPNCGKALQAGDAVCSRCGTPVGRQMA